MSVNSNRQIDNLIVTGKWEIEPNFALAALSQYMHELELLELGEHNVNYSERRESLQPILCFQGEPISGVSLSSSDIPSGSIAHMRLDGVMRMQDGLSSNGVRTLTQNIRAANRNPNISGVLLEVNSGGGETMAGTELQNAVKEFQKPFHVYGHLLASAAYKGVLPSSKITMSGMESQVGSIGSMVIIDKKIADYFRQNQHEIYAASSPNKNREWREYLMGNIQPLFQEVTDRNEFFLESVKQYRTLTGDEEQIKDTLSGHLFNAKTGIERGLVDAVGTFQDALQGIQEAVKSSQVKHFSFNNNSNNMDKNILQRIIGSLQSKFGMKVSQDADAEAVAAALEDTQSIDELRAQIVQEVTAEVQKNNTNDAVIQEIKTALAAQQSTITALNTANTKLEQKVAELTGNAINATQRNANSQAPNITQFNTGMDFNQRFLKPEPKES